MKKKKAKVKVKVKKKVSAKLRPFDTEKPEDRQMIICDVNGKNMM